MVVVVVELVVVVVGERRVVDEVVVAGLVVVVDGGIDVLVDEDDVAVEEVELVDVDTASSKDLFIEGTTPARSCSTSLGARCGGVGKSTTSSPSCAASITSLHIFAGSEPPVTRLRPATSRIDTFPSGCPTQTAAAS